MNYARGRRLTEAVRRLVDGDASILAVALDYGYGSHGAFTRAFRDEFGVTPEAFRRNLAQYALRLTEPVQMDNSKLIDLDRHASKTARASASPGLVYDTHSRRAKGDPLRRAAYTIGNAIAGAIDAKNGAEVFVIPKRAR